MGKGKDRHYRKPRGSDDSRSPSPKISRDSTSHHKTSDRHNVRRSRSRSRSRERRRDRHYRSRSRDRKSRGRRKSRSRSRSPHRKRDGKKRESRSQKESSSSHESENTKSKKSTKESISESSKTGESSLEAAKAVQEKIEEEMKKRKERLEAWRQMRQKEEEGEEETEEKSQEGDEEDDGEGKPKGWTLEDEDEDEEDNAVPMDDDTTADKDGGEGEGEGEGEGGGEKEMEMEDDVDPLDAFMVGVQEEVKQINTAFHKKMGAIDNNGKVGSTYVTVTKVKGEDKEATNETESKAGKVDSTYVTVTRVKGEDKDEKNTTTEDGLKGELLHNDQDAMEYSDEEEEGDEDLVSALKTIVKKNKGKDLPRVDHKKVEYPPFRKDFYVEVPELARMTKQEVAAARTDLENIKIKGKKCPNPVKTWAQCGLATKILDVMKKNSYERPTPIQAQAIPAVMSGRDLIGIAKTGSGKTLGFLLPMFRHVLDQSPLEGDDGPIAIIMTPTRELALQIYGESRKFCKLLKLWCVCVYGGTGISEQIADLKRGAEIVVCTPGRMIDMLAANNGRVTNLRRTTYLVLDEADRMFDMGFEPQVMKIIDNIRPDRQTVLFSATFPRQMEALARKILTKPIEVQVGGRSIVCREVHQSVIVIEDHQKFFKLLELLGIYCVQGSILVFVERQEAADALIRDLMKSSYSCMALHGGMDQFDRDSTISDFKNGSIKVLVATSVAARGLDVKHLILVINYDCPNHYEDYVHRCGRTGRAGNKGFAYTFITPDQHKYVGDILKALELSKAHIPEELEDMWKAYTDKLKAEGKIKSVPGGGRVVPIIRKKKAIGFTGKGFKFDDKEAARDVESKLKQKSALGMADDDDEDEFALLTLDKKLEDIFGNRVTVIDPNAPILPSIFSKPGLLPTPPQSERLSQAAAIANKIMQSKNKSIASATASGLAAQEAASSIMKGGDVTVSGAVLASQIAASINAKVGAGPAKAADTFLPIGTILPGQEKDQGQTFLKYTDEIEINSFPQQIRFRITTREVLDDIGEFSESYITVRGLYVHANREPKEGEKRLFLSLEAKSERAIQIAKQEIKRVIKEEAQRMASRIKPHRQMGRYSVL